MKKALLYIALALPLLGTVSCNAFLDELPDKRTEINTVDQIEKLLVSAYPTALPTAMFDIMSDNVDDNGADYDIGDLGRLAETSYYWETVPDLGIDDTRRVWEDCYHAIAVANEALKAIDKLDNPEQTNGVKSEALLCRAFGHFTLATTFCMAYNPQTSETDMGIPYAEEPETTVSPKYERGTVAEVYEKIDRDIEDALSIFSDDYLSQPKYHFNRRAAYAFAARFNLFYGEWEKTIEYATVALGNHPEELLRDWNAMDEFVNVEDWNLHYISSERPSNFLLLTQRSIYEYNIGYGVRYMHNDNACQKTLYQTFPWGSEVMQTSTRVWGDFPQTLVRYVPKVHMLWEISDPVAGIGTPHTVLTHFTADETLACRAEAYAMLNEYDAAAADLNLWYRIHNATGATFSAAQIIAFYSADRFHAKGSYEVPVMESRFGVTEGDQKAMVCAVLAMRRHEGLFEGMRFMDIKRHGIQVEHIQRISTTRENTFTLLPNDPRTAIQLPESVIFAGMPANPR
jgi:tetratricopeptide (TPR) repeat protein